MLAAAATLAAVAVLVTALESGGLAAVGLAGRTPAGERVAARRLPGAGARGPRPATPRRRAAARLAARGARVIHRLLRLGLPIYCGGPHGNEVAFTFDDGPGPYTHLALRKLRQAHERATFFDVGRSISLFPGYLRPELKVAAIGDHTYTHPPMTALPPSEVRWQLEATARKIRAGSGERVELWRPPYELHNATTDGIARRLGLLEILWDVDSQDSLGANWTRIISNVKAGLRPGAIVEMHENHGQTIRALTTLLPVLHHRHLRSVSVPQLLASDPPSNAQVRRGLVGCGLRGGRGRTQAE